ncbi:MAG: viroplasmin family protein [bacterium]|nr:viroplasmin family protein [bacterium]
MAQKFYVVWEGRERGIFTDWDRCKAQIDKFAGARYKSFKTRAEAEAAFRGGSEASIVRSPRAAGKFTAKVPRTYSAAEVAELPVQTKIFADGGCEPNPGQAGSGVAVYRDGLVDELWYGLYNPRGTNNTAELNALHQALLMAEKEIERKVTVAIFCDSRYAIQCVTQWAVSWEKKGWKKPGGDIKNLDLIQPAYALFTRLKKSVQVLHVNGHTGLEGNELADRMSIHGIDTKEKAFARYDAATDLDVILAMRKG